MNWHIDLQLFAEEEKTEQPTPKRRREAREKGQVFKSVEVNMVLLLLAVFITTKLFLRSAIGFFLEYQKGYFAMIGKDMDSLFTNDGLSHLFMTSVKGWFSLLWPVFIVALLTSVIANIAQVGFIFTTKTLTWNINKLNPFWGLKRVFSRKSLNELVKSVLKVVLVGYVIYTEINSNIDVFLSMSYSDISAVIYTIGDIVLSAGIKVTLILAIVAFIDYIFQRQDYEKELKMSKQEIKQEYKETEGDPLIKNRIRQIQRQLATMRMMQQVPKADVVITNPTHFAVALKYDEKVDVAPEVVAKGIDYMAQRIKDTARQNNVPIIENKDLARALYYGVDVGQIIPPEFYEMVAEVLAYVYNLRRQI